MIIDAVYAILIACLILWGLRRREECPQNDLISAEESGDWKGIFCIGILLRHFSSFIAEQGGPVVYLFSHVGKTIVGGFFFLSAYGLMKAYGQKALRPSFYSSVTAS